jgi:hypothetical protein
MALRKSSFCVSSDGGAHLKKLFAKVEFQSAEIGTRSRRVSSGAYNVTVLELVIKPNIGGGVARASLKNLFVLIVVLVL